ncbi:MAG: hypothetical protein Q4C87_10745 [Actinomycetaceae bacterium]|nr:hypothetical protein [Actinomycetaceae bacterium]
MQVLQACCKVPVDVVRQMRRVSSDAPEEIIVPYFAVDDIFSPLTEVEWYPELKCLAFAMGHNYWPIAFDLENNCVVQLIILGSDAEKWKVNSTLENYRRCAMLFIENAPYDDTDAEPGNIVAMLSLVEPGCADEGTFWKERAWDAGNGDWSTESFERDPLREE